MTVTPHLRRWLPRVGVALLAILAILYALYLISRAPCFQLIGAPVCKVHTHDRLIGLSFDDGPTPQGVDAVLPVLARYDAHATFFAVGQEIENHPGEVRKLVAAGQELGNHSYSHQRMIGLFPGAYETEIRRTDALLRGEGAATRWFRPPNTKKLTGLPIAVERTGYRTITWTFEDPMTEPDPRVYADKVLARIEPGAIVVMHVMYSSGKTARAALPLILEGLKTRGYRAVTIGELLQHEGR